jgi:hypothetical protein
VEDVEIEPTLWVSLRETMDNCGQVGSNGDGNKGTNHKNEFRTTLENIPICPTQKFQNPRTSTSGRKVKTGREEREREEKYSDLKPRRLQYFLTSSYPRLTSLYNIFNKEYQLGQSFLSVRIS